MKVCFCSFVCSVYLCLFIKCVNGSALEASDFKKKDDTNNINYNASNDLNVLDIIFTPVFPSSIGKHISVNENNKSKKGKNRKINEFNDIYILTDILSQLIPLNFAFQNEFLINNNDPYENNNNNNNYNNNNIKYPDENIIFLDLVNIYGTDFQDIIHRHLNKAKPIKGCEQDIINNKCDKGNILKCISLKKKELSTSCKNSLNNTLLYSCTENIIYLCKDTSQFSKIYKCLIDNIYFLDNTCSNTLNYYKSVVQELHKKNFTKDNFTKENSLPLSNDPINYSHDFVFIATPEKDERNSKKKYSNDKTYFTTNNSSMNVRNNSNNAKNNSRQNKYESLEERISRRAYKRKERFSNLNISTRLFQLVFIIALLVTGFAIFIIVNNSFNKRMKNKKKSGGGNSSHVQTYNEERDAFIANITARETDKV